MSTIASTDRARPWRGGPHGEAIDVLYEAIARGERLVVLTGPPGVGKTIVIDALVTQLSAARMRTARLVVPVSSAADLLSAIALALRLPPDVRSREALTTAVRDEGLLTIVMDDAQAAGDDALAELGVLLGAESRFAAVIAGDDTLGARLASALPSRRPLIHALRPLDEAEGIRFIAETITVPGYRSS